MAAPKLADLVDQYQTQTRTSQKGYISDTKMGKMIDSAGQQLCAFLCGLLMQYQPGRPVSNVSSEVTSDVNELLQPLRFLISAYQLEGGGAWELRQGNGQPYIYKVESWEADGEQVRKPVATRKLSIFKSKIRKPSVQFPAIKYMTDNFTKIIIEPNPSDLVVQAIIKVPKTVLVFNDEFKVDETLSQEIIWTDRAIPYLLNFMTKSFGAQTEATPLMQYAMTQEPKAL